MTLAECLDCGDRRTFHSVPRAQTFRRDHREERGAHTVVIEEGDPT